MVFDNGSWAAALKRPNVRLVTDAITRVTPTGVETADTRYDADVLVFATGFLASHFLEPVRVTGRDGTDLHAMWQGDARAYLGVTVPKFPNMFLLYGPNTNIVVNGSIIYFSECEVRYVLGCLRLLLQGGHDALEVRSDVHDAYNRSVDAANDGRVWGAAHVNTWYKNALGRVSQNWPFTLQDYWRRTREPDPGDYTFLSAKVHA
jgi:4-hydroxyacetophenone monooxygenase